MSIRPDHNKIRLARHHLSWRVWDGSAVVFEPFSGDTHRIDRPGGDILLLLATSDTDHASVYTALGSVASKESINEALGLLMALELVESN